MTGCESAPKMLFALRCVHTVKKWILLSILRRSPDAIAELNACLFGVGSRPSSIAAGLPARHKEPPSFPSVHTIAA